MPSPLDIPGAVVLDNTTFIRKNDIMTIINKLPYRYKVRGYLGT